jgi:hypothetical protein
VTFVSCSFCAQFIRTKDPDPAFDFDEDPEFKYGYQNNAKFYADFKTAEKNSKNLLPKKF